MNIMDGDLSKLNGKLNKLEIFNIVKDISYMFKMFK